MMSDWKTLQECYEENNEEFPFDIETQDGDVYKVIYKRECNVFPWVILLSNRDQNVDSVCGEMPEFRIHKPKQERKWWRSSTGSVYTYTDEELKDCWPERHSEFEEIPAPLTSPTPPSDE